MLNNDRTIALPSIITAGCWLIGACLILSTLFYWLPDHFGTLGLAFIAFGHLVVLRADHCRQEGREFSAFEIGRDSVRHIH